MEDEAMKDLKKIIIFMVKITVAMVVLYAISIGVTYLTSFLPESAGWVKNAGMVLVLIVLIVLLSTAAGKYLFVGVDTKAFTEKQKQYLNQFTLFSVVIMQVLIPMSIPVSNNISIFSGSPRNIPELIIKSLYSALWLSFVYSYMLRLDRQQKKEDK